MASGVTRAEYTFHPEHLLAYDLPRLGALAPSRASVSVCSHTDWGTGGHRFRTLAGENGFAELAVSVRSGPSGFQPSGLLSLVGYAARRLPLASTRPNLALSKYL